VEVDRIIEKPIEVVRVVEREKLVEVPKIEIKEIFVDRIIEKPIEITKVVEVEKIVEKC
jgi:hypothetical protein